MSICNAWGERTKQWHKPSVLQTQQETEILCLRDRDERNYVRMMEVSICDHTDGHERRPGNLSDCLLSVPYDSLPFLTWSGVWREAAKYGAKHCARHDDVYFVRRHNSEYF